MRLNNHSHTCGLVPCRASTTATCGANFSGQSSRTTATEGGALPAARAEAADAEVAAVAAEAPDTHKFEPPLLPATVLADSALATGTPSCSRARRAPSFSSAVSPTFVAASRSSVTAAAEDATSRLVDSIHKHPAHNATAKRYDKSLQLRQVGQRQTAHLTQLSETES